ALLMPQGFLQKSPFFCSAILALFTKPPKADSCSALAHVRFGPIADTCSAAIHTATRSFRLRGAGDAKARRDTALLGFLPLFILRAGRSLCGPQPPLWRLSFGRQRA